MADASGGVASGLYWVTTGKFPMEDMEDKGNDGGGKGGGKFGSIAEAHQDLTKHAKGKEKG